MQDTEIRIVQLGPGDEPQLACCAEDLVDPEASPAGLAALLGNPHAHLFVAVCGTMTIGLGCGHVLQRPDGPPDFHVGDLRVAPEWRRRGVGGRLFDALASAARADGCMGIWVLAEPDNVQALRFYQSFGLGVTDGLPLSARF